MDSCQLIISEPVHNQVTPVANASSDELRLWQASMTYAEDLAGIFLHWKPDYFHVADPLISCAIWHAYCGMMIYKMSGCDKGTPGLDTRVGNALDLLSISLENFARRWQIARLLQGKHGPMNGLF